MTSWREEIEYVYKEKDFFIGCNYQNSKIDLSNLMNQGKYMHMHTYLS